MPKFSGMIVKWTLREESCNTLITISPYSVPASKIYGSFPDVSRGSYDYIKENEDVCLSFGLKAINFGG